MNYTNYTTKQLSESQKKAIEIVQRLVKEEKMDFNDAFALIVAIYENEKEYVYIPSTSPYEPYKPWTTEPYPGTTPWCPNTPWYQQPIITCQLNTNDISTDKKPGYELYALGYTSDLTF